jgi:hypothetical protein
MVVTLEVLKLSGWLNADADCRVERRACDAGGERWEPGGGRACGVVAAHKRHAWGWPESRPGGQRARAVRTWNMAYMVVTLEVSKLSGWSKAYAFCRVEERAYDEGEVRAGKRDGLVWWRHTRGMHEEGPTQCLGPRARAKRTLNILNMSVTLEVLKLSGWLNADADCRVEGRACDAEGRGARRVAGGPVVAAAHKRHMHGEGPTQGLGAKGTWERTKNM